MGDKERIKELEENNLRLQAKVSKLATKIIQLGGDVE